MLSSNEKKKLLNKSFPLAKFLIIFGLICLILSLIIFWMTFSSVIFQEVSYSLKSTKIKPLIPQDKNFGLIIPKIAANAKIIANVDPFNEKEYQWQLTKGVVQAKGTAFPDQYGNIFIFSHSSVNWYEANRYNSIFYLLHKLKTGDEIYIYYQQKKFTYKIKQTKIVEPTAVNYLLGDSKKKTLTLMTCWPPGTTFKRLIVIAEQINGI